MKETDRVVMKSFLMIIVIITIAFIALKDPTPTGYATKNPNCGNNVCDWWESNITCPEDCEEKYSKEIGPTDDSFVKVWESSKTPITVDVDKKELAIQKISIDLVKDLGRIQIMMERDYENITKNNFTYIYQSIKTDKTIKDSDIRKITYRYNIPDSWIQKNKITERDVYIYSYEDGAWKRASTKLLSSGTINYYEASMDSFIDFVIASEKKGVEESPVIMNDDEIGSQPDIHGEKEKINILEELKSRGVWIIGIGGGILLIMIIGILLKINMKGKM